MNQAWVKRTTAEAYVADADSVVSPVAINCAVRIGVSVFRLRYTELKTGCVH